MTTSDSVDEGGDVGVGWDTAPANVREQLRIGQVENSLEARDFALAQPLERLFDERQHNGVELAHAAPTTPPEPLELGSSHRTKTSRSGASA